MYTTKAEQQRQEVVMQTCGEDHVNEAKADEESSGQEEVGLPDHQHHHVHQHSCAKHHAAHRHTCHQHTYTHIKTCSRQVLKTGLLCLLVLAVHRRVLQSLETCCVEQFC